ncbi:hypothetical protein JEM57_10405 [Escherichia albertii]|uniref:hypothetical protein n=1 Tax=Escherichia albertii TaxID=208962 RepID=UPI001D87B331|nr:hypothetical protein [Escherichia albertii]EHX2144246.1 hypothetical protein [Escherichia albertii]MCE7721095.1 hypothetical protein [Escherichia albertii]MCE7724918.1 hypothetical protein [Escherichia albertii]MCZ8864567.1 hypothetical protein [Escherichia albertii]
MRFGQDADGGVAPLTAHGLPVGAGRYALTTPAGTAFDDVGFLVAGVQEVISNEFYFKMDAGDLFLLFMVWLFVS